MIRAHRPSAPGRYLGDPNPQKAQNVLQAMLKMSKIDIAGLTRAYEEAWAAQQPAFVTRSSGQVEANLVFARVFGDRFAVAPTAVVPLVHIRCPG